jgi:hypothetical protein
MILTLMFMVVLVFKFEKDTNFFFKVRPQIP